MSELPNIDRWCAWTPSDVFKRIGRVDRPWHVAGGWALDLWLGRQTRQHGDLEISVLRSDFSVFREAIGPFSFFAAKNGVLTPLEVDECPAPDVHQVWVLDAVERCWKLDLFLDPGDDLCWTYRRDHSVQVSRRDCVALSENGVPFLAPEIVMLYKAKRLAAKDRSDFDVCVPFLEPAARRWLSRMIEKYFPSHEWQDRLRSMD